VIRVEFTGVELRHNGTSLKLLAHPAKTESADVTVRDAGELSADLDVLWNIQNGRLAFKKLAARETATPNSKTRGSSLSSNHRIPAPG
jgi:hypothetical protein